jgi:hypothetical protein
MLIFEPNHYPKLSPNNGDKVFDYHYGDLVGEVLEVYSNGNIRVIIKDGSEWVYEPTGVSYQAGTSEGLDKTYLEYFKIVPSKRANKRFSPLTNRIKLC